MQGLMMDRQLTITSIMEHVDTNHPNAEIVSVTCDEPRHRHTYAEAFRRTRRLANALLDYGVQPGDRIATFAWNDYRHFELYYAVAGIGAVTPHGQPAPVPGPDRLYRQPCGGQAGLCRSVDCAGAGKNQG